MVLLLTDGKGWDGGLAVLGGVWNLVDEGDVISTC